MNMKLTVAERNTLLELLYSGGGGQALQICQTGQFLNILEIKSTKPAPLS
jgi:hypothetical protein